MPTVERDRTMTAAQAEAEGDDLRKAGRHDRALEAYLLAAGGAEPPSAALCLKLARGYERLENRSEALRWALAVVDAPDDFASWQAAAALAQRSAGTAAGTRSARLALLGSYTTSQLVPMLRLAALRFGI